MGYRTLAGEFCVVNGEFSDLQCLMNNLRLRDFCVPVSPLCLYVFFNGPECVAFTFIPHKIWSKVLP